MNFLIENYEWIFSGIGVVIVGFLIRLLRPKKKSSEKKIKQTNQNNITINNTISNSTSNGNETNI